MRQELLIIIFIIVMLALLAGAILSGSAHTYFLFIPIVLVPFVLPFGRGAAKR